MYVGLDNSTLVTSTGQRSALHHTQETTAKRLSLDLLCVIVLLAHHDGSAWSTGNLVGIKENLGESQAPSNVAIPRGLTSTSCIDRMAHAYGSGGQECETSRESPIKKLAFILTFTAHAT